MAIVYQNLTDLGTDHKMHRYVANVINRALRKFDH